MFRMCDSVLHGQSPYDMGTRRAAMWDKCVHGQRALETMPGRGQEAVMLADSSITSWKVKDTLYFGDGLSFFFFFCHFCHLFWGWAFGRVSGNEVFWEA